MSGKQACYAAQEIRLSAQHWRILQTEAERLAPQEACGLLWGTCQAGYYDVVEVRPVDNVLESPTRYRMNPAQQIRVFLEMEERNLQLVGIYHSHSQGPEHPSETDILEAYYPQAVYIILSPGCREWQARGFLIQENQVSEVKVEVESEQR
jgi:proteasome lid subunit RPN8/RPN11